MSRYSSAASIACGACLGVLAGFWLPSVAMADPGSPPGSKARPARAAKTPAAPLKSRKSPSKKSPSKRAPVKQAPVKQAPQGPLPRGSELGRAPWPSALKDRMSRYARFGRMDDAAGDEREEVRLAMQRQRVVDREGDRLELARARLESRGHRACRDAALARVQTPRGDRAEAHLATLSRMRTGADFRRHMLIPADELAELHQYQRDYARFGDPLEKVGIADERGDERGLRKERDSEQRRSEGAVKRRDEERPDPTERGEEARSERLHERLLGRERDPGDEMGDLEERDSEAQAERDAAKLEGRQEAKDEAQLEREAEKAERAEDRSDESRAERNDDRRDEKTIRQAEESDLGS